MMNDKTLTRLRIDKWLWAARFFKTRSLAKQAIDGGKVHCNGQRCKPSKEIELGDKLTVRQGWDEKKIVIIALNEQRRSAPEAQKLYEETIESIELRASRTAERKAMNTGHQRLDERPNKKQRRQIHRFKQLMDDLDD